MYSECTDFAILQCDPCDKSRVFLDLLPCQTYAILMGPDDAPAGKAGQDGTAGTENRSRGL